MKRPIRLVLEWISLIIVFFSITLGIPAVLWNFYDLTYTIVDVLSPWPTANILALSTIDAYHLFAGEPIEGIGFSNITVMALFSILFYLFLGPWLMYFGCKKAQRNQKKAKPIIWYAGGIICLVSLTFLPTISVFSIQKNQVNDANDNIMHYMDMLRHELLDIGVSVAEHEILNKNIDEDFSLDDLDLGELNFNYSISSIQEDTLIVLTGGFVEDQFLITAEVRPYGDKIITFRNE